MHTRICAGYRGKDTGGPSKSLSTKARLVEVGDIPIQPFRGADGKTGWLKTLGALSLLKGEAIRTVQPVVMWSILGLLRFHNVYLTL